ncbi:hypothetical protein ACSFVZ_19850 [Pseudoalteromonas sp. SYSU M81236]|uniref:hypothetical protein n=1 Tax=Pseudoalteromonas sp. SYSU M81236 TaxID=3447014 RepID=UPI003F1211E9
MTTFEITTTLKNIYSLHTGKLLCSEVIKHHTSLKDVLRDLDIDVDASQRGKYLKALSLLNDGVPLNKVISAIAGGADE